MPVLYFLLFTMLFGTMFGIACSVNFKIYGLFFSYDDKFIAKQASLSSIIASFFQLFMGVLIDNFSYK